MLCPYCLLEMVNKDNCQFCGHPADGADLQWWVKLSDYNYPTDLQAYSGKNNYPGYFNLRPNNRESTIRFEDHFRQTIMSSDLQIGLFLEVVYWKMYSQRGRAEIRTDAMATFLSADGDRTSGLKKAIDNFVLHPSNKNATLLISACGLRSRTIAVAFTFPALYRPDLYPMVDKRVAKWVNNKLTEQNLRRTKLIPFRMSQTSLQMDDFNAYLCWVEWCREQALLLNTLQPKINWRPRDVEMACFTDTTHELPALKG